MPGLGALKLIFHGTQGLPRWEDSFSILKQSALLEKDLMRMSTGPNRLPQLLTSCMMKGYNVVAPNCPIAQTVRLFT